MVSRPAAQQNKNRFSSHLRESVEAGLPFLRNISFKNITRSHTAKVQPGGENMLEYSFKFPKGITKPFLPGKIMAGVGRSLGDYLSHYYNQP